MRSVITTMLVLGFALSAGLVRGSEDGVADSLTTTAEAFLGKGETEKAKDYLFKALFHSEKCAAALFDLGKIYQTENNNVAAADFFSSAIHQMENLENNRPEFVGKIGEAKTRLRSINPYAGQLDTAMEDYSQELCRILKKNNDSLTNDDVASHIQSLALASYVPAGKLPEVQKAVDPPKVVKHNNGGNGYGRESNYPPAEDTEVTTVVPPSIERALKSAGWDTIKGVWKEKSSCVYEVTDGKLETNKTNGGVQVMLYTGGSGTVSVFVRNANKDPYIRSSSSTQGTSASGSMIGHSYWASGYGFTLTDRDGKSYSAGGGGMGWGGMNGTDFYPAFDHNFSVTAAPKHIFSVTAQDDPNGKATAFTVLIDGSKKEVNTRYKLPKEGPMTIIIKGTATIENPVAAGQ